MRYFEDLSPSTGGREPRAWLRSSRPRIDLNGSWSFKLWDGAPDGIPTVDESWGALTVPGHWVLQGHERPRYTNTAFPFPIDPPYTPDANPTGDHVRTFDVPEYWPVDGAVLRFEGVDSCFKVWVNGIEVGTAKGSRLPSEFVVGEHLRPGRNLLAVRVHQWSSGSYLEDQDMWWLPGIFRDVTLLARPLIDDVFVHASYDHLTGAGTLRVETVPDAVVRVPELGIVAAPGESVAIDAVEPWSAEEPRLYDATVDVPGETVELRIGFRTVAMVDGLFTANGRPLFFRGVNRHEHDERRGRAMTVEAMRQDLVLMKQHNVNAVRTAHYPPHPAFLDLCDELGLWVIDECDIETHGFIYTDWRGNPADDPDWAPMMLDRMRRMVERDKNHPSVVIWSLANESHRGRNFGTLAAWTRERDPDRAVFYERDRTYEFSDFYSLMYPPLEDLEAIGTRTEDVPDETADRPDLEARRRALPFILAEYAHAMGNGPGGLADYQRILEHYPRLQGGFVWEWIDHGLLLPGATDHVYGGDFGERLHGANFCIDGLLFPDRTPSPGLLEYKKVLEPIRITGPDPLTVHNHRTFTGVDDLTLVWSITTDGTEVASGHLEAPDISPGRSADLPTPAAPFSTDEQLLTVRAVLAKDTAWAAAGHEVAWAQFPVEPPAAPAAAEAAEAASVLEGSPTAVLLEDGEVLRLGGGEFDRATGQLTRLFGHQVDGLVLDLWRAPTDNDNGQGGRNGVTQEWRAAGLDRLLHRVESVEVQDDGLLVRARVAPEGLGLAVRTTYRWRAYDDQLQLTVDVQPEGEWAGTAVTPRCGSWPRVGVRMTLPRTLENVQWYGGGPGESYADSRETARVGRYECTVDELQTPYVVPQENGARTDVRWAELTDADGNGLRVTGAPLFQLTARRWTTEDLETARHRSDLTPRDHIYVNLDLAQNGLGSASCGPPTRDSLQVAPYTYTLGFHAVKPRSAGPEDHQIP
ncbi:glycoside hydrolase family 2 TIM barrel-domain containing protein [Kribbella sp. CA-245084]|uniref:glycoside hydrolase family 2 TIM barrel-domain containing protein n=1 Tax=Kribbella sp. CA-245084 TaxID=3239940 RepID=UPI003D92FD1F